MAEPDWKPDPTGKHELRYHDGAQWTDNVSDDGVTSLDPFRIADVAKGGGIKGLARVAARQAVDSHQASKAAGQAAVAARDAQVAAERAARIEAGELMEYRVELVRETLIGDKIKTDELQRLLNQVAADGWHLKTITSAAVAGRVGGNTGGLIVTFERPVKA